MFYTYFADQSLHYPPEVNLNPWLPTECPAKNLIRLRKHIFAVRTCSLVGNVVPPAYIYIYQLSKNCQESRN